MDNLSVTLFNQSSEIHFSSSKWAESEVLLAEDGEIQSAINIDFPLVIFKIVCSVIGIPLNALLFLTIICKRRLLINRPRNIFLLATVASNLMAFIPSVLEIVHYLYPNELTCKLYVATFGLPDIFLLQNIFLSQIDRYVAIREPLWHRTKVTVPLATLSVIVLSVISILVNKFLYIFQLVRLDCHVHFVHGKMIGSSLIALFTLCMVARIIVYLQTRKLLCVNNTSTTNGSSKESGIEMAEKRAAVGGGNYRKIKIELNATALNQKTLRQLEDAATKTMVAGVTSLIFLTCPLLVFFVIATVCRKMHGPLKCSHIIRLSPYFKQLGLIHAIYHPIMHLVWNKELFSNSEQPSSNDNRRRVDSTYD